MQSLPKMAKIEVANAQLPVCFETVFVFPEHCAFCLCEVFDALPSIFQYIKLPSCSKVKLLTFQSLRVNTKYKFSAKK